MEIPACLYFSFWAIIGATFLYLGFDALDKTDLSETVSPIIMSIFMHSLAISTCHSSAYSLLFLPQLKIPPDTYYIWMMFAVFPLVFNRFSGGLFEWYYPIYSLINLCILLFYFLPRLKPFVDQYYILVLSAFFPLQFYITKGGIVLWYFLMYTFNFTIIVSEPRVSELGKEKFGLVVQFGVESTIFCLVGKTKFFPVLVLALAFFSSVYWAAIAGDKRFKKWLPRSSSKENIVSIVSILNKWIFKIKGTKEIEFAVGMLGTILFQYFFRLTSFNHVVAFLYIAVAWLANLALLMSSHDFGIFNFLLTNVVISCIVNQFGLQGTTWIAYGASIFLYILRLKLKSLSLVNNFCMVKSGDGEEEEKNYYCIILTQEEGIV